jgi:hypothetical protein
MAKLQLSERFRNAIEQIRTYDEERFSALVTALTHASRPNAQTIAATLPAGISDAEDIVDAVFGLYHTSASADVTQERFMTDLIDTLRPKWPQDVGAEAEQEFRTRISRLMSIDSIAAITKAARVLTDYERAFYDVKILSDLRPVFPTDPSSGPIGMGIVHTLELLFHKTGRSHEKFYIALTTADLKKIRSALDRAEIKAGTLRDGLTQSGVRYLEGD